MTTIPTCVITGAGSGIGAAATELFVRDGFRVVACGRNEDKLEKLRASLDGPGEVLTGVLDVRDGAAVRGLFDRVGPVDVLVANAGVCRQARLDEPESDAVWRELIDINLTGAYNCIRAAAGAMRDGGSIVAVSSGLGKNARPGYEAYCASKHGLQGLVKAVALELAPRGIRANTVCPGWVDTAMSRADVEVSAGRQGVSTTEFRRQSLASIPLGRMVQPQEVASLIRWLASPGASAITGQAYNISCGEFSN